MNNFSEALEKQLSSLELFNRIKNNPEFKAIYEAEDRLNKWSGLTDSIKEGIEHSLAFGETYYWPREFCKMLWHLVDEFPRTWTPYQEDFLSESGFVYFEDQFMVPQGDYPMPNDDHLKEARRIAEATGGTISDFWLSPGYVTPEYADWALSQYEHDSEFRKERRRYLNDRIKFTQNINAISWVWSRIEQESYVQFFFWAKDGYELWPWWGYVWHTKDDLQTILDQFTEGSWPLGHYLAIERTAVIIAFMAQRIISHDREVPTRATRRRISQWRPEPIVNVIRLRRIKKKTDNTDHEPIDWAYQWSVRGHWRNQWYAKEGRHEVIWIAPFVKGPEGKPFKAPRNSIFVVTR